MRTTVSRDFFLAVLANNWFFVYFSIWYYKSLLAQIRAFSQLLSVFWRGSVQLASFRLTDKTLQINLPKLKPTPTCKDAQRRRWTYQAHEGLC